MIDDDVTVKADIVELQAIVVDSDVNRERLESF